ncbi:hypothetical protein EZV62_008186 [Acer yangbiense]|uniref:Integrase catalytic domain-containing protein n=1 Tax=Acer yangbiense TaxID=1000413 RepID=A0A5C7ICN6_9ROSI|nr:hypothetical protein EZV62_008186 [Acer yangbiense]
MASLEGADALNGSTGETFPAADIAEELNPGMNKNFEVDPTSSDISTSLQIKQELKELAYSTIILNLVDNILRQVNDEDTAAKVRNKLESLYMTKSLSGKIYLKEQLFGFKMDQSKSLEDNLDDFTKLNIELANADSTEALSDENQAIIVLNSLLDSYNDLKATIKYGRDSLTLEDVLGALRSREMEMRSEKKASTGEGLNVRGRTEKKNSSRKGRGKSRSKSRAKGKRQGLLCGDSIGKLDLCEHCIIGKQTRLKFSIGVHTSKGTLDYVHLDVWGPARVNSHGGNRYFITIIDDFSRKVWLYLMKHKNEALNKFREWKTLVEKQFERKVKKLWTNNGLEFCSDEFTDFCKKEGDGFAKSIISRDVTFKEDELLGLQPATQNQSEDAQSIEKVQIEVEPSQVTELNFYDIPEQNEEQTGQNFEEQDNLQNYLLARVRKRRQLIVPKKYGYADVVAYALNTAMKESDLEPLSYHQAMKIPTVDNPADMATKVVPMTKFKHCLGLVQRLVCSTTVNVCVELLDGDWLIAGSGIIIVTEGGFVR